VAENAIIIANGFVFCCDPTNQVGRFHLFVQDGRIQEIGGTLTALTTLHPSAAVVDAAGKLIVPGFVNAHYHTHSFLLHELTDGKPFSSWKTSRPLRDLAQLLIEPGNAGQLETIVRAEQLAHLKSGTTCVGEFPPSVDAAGLDLLFSVADAIGVRTVVMLQNWEQIVHAREDKDTHRKFLVSVGKEEDYTVYSFENFVRSAKELGCPVVVHAGELREDVELVRKNFTKSLCTLLKDFGALQPSTLLVHMNHAANEDVENLMEIGAAVALCTASAGRKQTGYPFLRALADHPARLCLGTDWGSVDMFTEMRFLLSLPKLFAAMPAISPVDVVRMATIEGAAALGLGEDIGSIEVGKCADLSFYSLDDIRIKPPRDGWTADECAELIVGSLSSQDVADVMVEGRFLLRNRQTLALSEQDIIADFRKLRERVLPQEGLQAVATSSVLRPKTYAFATGERTLNRESEDFVEGFVVVKKTPGELVGTTKNAPPPEPPAPPIIPRLGVQPELSKTVKKVFGEDEDF